MERSFLAPDGAEKKQKAVQDAKDMYQEIRRNCERTNTAVPPFDFIELIGKGAFGRVYKCREQSTGELVAIKIVDTDEVDYHQDSLDKDDTIRDFRKEVTILQQLKDSNAKNVNLIHDAFDLQQQLWIVSDYCTGGSIRTLMRAQPATHPGLEEHFIVPIARELALAMKSVHDIGVIHRDMKCTNVYVTEEGEIQLGDFGIVGVLDDGVSKRQTMIGTPHYMPREMLIHGTGNQVAEAYGTEVDVWSYGCTVFEMATGMPPNAVKRQDMLRNELLVAPRLEGAQYSQGLRDFVAFCLNSDPVQRPTAEQVLEHPYVANTQKRYPTRKLVDLIHRFKAWEYSGGVRQSLWLAGGAPPVGNGGEKADSTKEDEFDEWNFSTSDSFNEAYDKRYSHIPTEAQQGLDNEGQDATKLTLLFTDMSVFERLQQQHKDLSANRGERSLERLFTTESEPYELHTPVDDPPSPIHDLPFRKFGSGAQTRESHITAPVRDSQMIIDLDTGEDEVPSSNFDFGDAPTLKAREFQTSLHDDEDDGAYQYDDATEDRTKRITMDWKFPTSKPSVNRATMEWKFPAAAPEETDDAGDVFTFPSSATEDGRPALKHSVTEPTSGFREHIPRLQRIAPAPLARESMASMIDLDLGLGDPADIARPSTANSTAESIMTDTTLGGPFDLDDDSAESETDRNRFSYHKQWQSEGGQFKRSSHLSIPMHTRGSSLSSSASEFERPPTADSEDVFELDYNAGITGSMRAPLNGSFADNTIIMNQWPNFGSEAGYDRERTYNDGLDDMVRRQHDREAAAAREREHMNGYSTGHQDTAAPRPEIDFPRITAPHPDLLRDGVDPNFMAAELDRTLADLTQALQVTMMAMQRFGGIEDDEVGNETGVESVAEEG